MLLLNIAILLVLIQVSRQDFRSFSLYWFLPPVLTILFLVKSMINLEPVISLYYFCNKSVVLVNTVRRSIWHLFTQVRQNS